MKPNNKKRKKIQPVLLAHRGTGKSENIELEIVGRKGKGKSYYHKYLKNDKMEMPSNKQLKIDSKKIGKFLKELTFAEYSFITKTVNLATSIQGIIQHYKLTKEQFCDGVKIKKNQYDDYVSGNRNYSLQDISRIEAFHQELLKKEAETKAAIVSIAK